jgi:hypothetical protein
VRDTAIWIPIVTIFALVSPLLFTQRSFGHDWTLHLWLTWRQQLNIQSSGFPGYFVSGDHVGPFPFGVFYPIFAFAGGTLYAIGAYLSLLLGDRVIVSYILLYVLATCMAYLGFTWLSHSIGLRGWRTQVGGAVFVTGTYYLTNMYGRGDLGEFVATSAIPLAMASICSLITRRSWRIRDFAAFVLAIVLLSGSHNISLLWAIVFLFAGAIVVLVAFRPTWRTLPRRRLLAIGGVGALALGVNAWFLLPDLAYGTKTIIALANAHTHSIATGMSSADFLFNPFRPATEGFGRGLRDSLPWMAVVWALVAAGFSWRSAHAPKTKRLFEGTLIVGLVFTLFATRTDVWLVLPRFFLNTQFNWRLHTYVLLCAAVLVMLALRLLMSSVPRSVTGKRLSAALVVILVFGGVAGLVQVWATQSRIITLGVDRAFPGSRDQVVRSTSKVPVSWYAVGDFRDGDPPIVPAEPTRTMVIAPGRITGSSFHGRVDAPPGRAPFVTNIGTSTRFVKIRGIEVLGRNRDGLLVARRIKGAPPTGPVMLSIEPADSWPIVLGQIVTWISMLGLIVLGVLISLSQSRHGQGAVARWRARRAERT